MKATHERGLVPRTLAGGRTVWYAVFRHHGRVRWFGSFPRKGEARAFYEQAKTEQRQARFFPEQYQRRPGPTLGSLIEAYMADNRKASRKEDARYAAWWTARAGARPITEIEPADLEAARRDLSAAGRAPQTVMHYLKFLRHLCRRALRARVLTHTPFDQLPLPAVRTGPTRWLTETEEQRLLEALGPHAPAARFALLTGLRKAEQFGLRWAQIDWTARILTLPETKAGRLQYLPLSSEAIALLRGIQGRQTPHSVWVFASTQPARPLNAANFHRRVWDPARRTAGLEDVRWHDLRHTFASRLASAGLSEYTLATLLRHSSTALVRRYAHLAPGHLRDAVELLASPPALPAHT